ncbi:hypothetical protein JCM10449v2_001407 [Rhodotorula kratochvilovae]
MRLTPILLVAGAGALGASASAHPQPLDVSPAHTHQLDARSPLSIGIGGINICIGLFCNRPSRSWKCSGSGKDGYSVDYNGNSRPSWAPSGFLYFGTEIGWAPPKGWSCSTSWDIPDALSGKLGLITWWKPTSTWLDARVGFDLGFNAPSWWGFVLAPSRGWKCSGSGKDGFAVDYSGNGRPSWAPSGWLWFGSSIGWAPPAGWTCSSSFELPGRFVDVIDLVTWWKPSTGWLDAHVGIDLGFTAPSWWGFVLAPSRGWKCSGSGKDGFTIDYSGNGRPSWAPAGWLWFGSSIGWAPPAGWSCGSTWEIPSQWRSTCSKATWWTPPSGWVTKHRSREFGWSLPIHWGIDSCGCSCGCSGGSEGIRTTTATTTSKVAKTTTPAATTSKGATKTTTRPAATTSKSTAKTTKKASTTSKKPATTSTSRRAVATKTVTYVQPSTITIPGNVVTVTRTVSVAVPTSTGHPGYGWQCNGSGKDGYEVDWQGNGRPSHYPEGWYWFGVSIGWAPGASWSCSSSWKPSSLQITVIVNTQISWWVPPANWTLPSGVKCPHSWTSRGWIDRRIPSASFQCNGKGDDGYDFDHEGNSRPAGSAVGWKWFGRAHGWQPCASFQLPSADWEAPAWWAANRGVWWRPTTRWNLRRSYKCPTFWRASRSHLRGSWVWW